MGLKPNIGEEMLGPSQGPAQALAQGPGPHFLLNRIFGPNQKMHPTREIKLQGLEKALGLVPGPRNARKVEQFCFWFLLAG